MNKLATIEHETIKFEAEYPEQFNAYPHPEQYTPKAASRFIPKWFKEMSPDLKGDELVGTIKRCPPVTDAMCLGYIIPLWVDVEVTATESNIDFNLPSAWSGKKVFDNHGAEQIAGYPKTDDMHGVFPVKFINPWVITTPPGWSCLFLNPINQFEKRWHFFEGVVHTDTYYNNVNFPFVWTAGEGKVLIERGTPLLQVVPFRRDNLILEVGIADEPKLNSVRESLGTMFKNAYRTLHRGK